MQLKPNDQLHVTVCISCHAMPCLTNLGTCSFPPNVTPPVSNHTTYLPPNTPPHPFICAALPTNKTGIFQLSVNIHISQLPTREMNAISINLRKTPTAKPRGAPKSPNNAVGLYVLHNPCIPGLLSKEGRNGA